MKPILTLVPFVTFGAAVLWLTFVSDRQTWLLFGAVALFVVSLLLIPLISKASLFRGYVAITYLLLVVVFSVMMSSSERIRDRPSGYTRAFVGSGVGVPLEVYAHHIGRYPTTEDGLEALVRCPKRFEAKWKGPYLYSVSGGLPMDPWGRPYQYRCPGVHNPERYDIWSLGPDGKLSDDDIGNWTK